MFNKTIWPTRGFFGPMAIFYLIMLAFYCVMQRNKMIPMPLIAVQVAAVILTYFFSFLYSKKSIAVTCLIIFLFQLIASFSLRYYNIDYFHNPLGYKPVDARFYHEIAGRFYRYSLSDFILFMDNNDLMLDDRGMNYVTYFIYKISGSPEKGLMLAVFINVCFITLSSYFVYGISNIFIDNRFSQFAAFVWGTQLYSTYTAASGLKENFMVLFIIISLYYIAKLYNEFTYKNIVLAIVFAAFALFFRMALFYMLLSSILFVVAMKYPLFRRYVYFLIVVSLFLTWYSYQHIFDEMAVMRRGADAMDYDTYQGLIEGKMNQAGIFASIISYLSALIGPLPNVVASGAKVNYITLFSFSSFCKSFYAFYFLYAIYVAIKKKRMEILSLLVFWLLDVVMLLITFFTLHDRYHWPHVPIVIILSVWGALEWHNNKPPKILHQAYFVITLILITIFNFR